MQQVRFKMQSKYYILTPYVYWQTYENWALGSLTRRTKHDYLKANPFCMLASVVQAADINNTFIRTWLYSLKNFICKPTYETTFKNFTFITRNIESARYIPIKYLPLYLLV